MQSMSLPSLSQSTTQGKLTSKSVVIHPLCIASICDHYTRIVNGGSKLSPQSPTIGLLFGIQSNSNISIIDAADAIYDTINGDIVLNISGVKRIKALIIEVYPTYDLIGWYTTGIEITSNLMNIHQTLIREQLNESPILLMLNQHPISDSKQFPISVYESEIHVINDHFSPIFVEIPFKLETGQVEKISIDQVTKIAAASSITSSIETQNKAMITSILTFSDKINHIIDILSLMKNKTIPYNFELVRKANKILHQLPTSPSSEFTNSIEIEINECYIMSYIASTMKISKDVHNLSLLYQQLDSITKNTNISNSSNISSSSGTNMNIGGSVTGTRMSKFNH